MPRANSRSGRASGRVIRAVSAASQRISAPARRIVMHVVTRNVLSLLAAVMVGGWLLQRSGWDPRAAANPAAATRTVQEQSGAARRGTAMVRSAAGISGDGRADLWDASGAGSTAAPAPLMVYLVAPGPWEPGSALDSLTDDATGAAGVVVLPAGTSDELAVAVDQLQMIEAALAMRPVAQSVRVIDLRRAPVSDQPAGSP
jgi:hypothetical protein